MFTPGLVLCRPWELESIDYLRRGRGQGEKD